MFIHRPRNNGMTAPGILYPGFERSSQLYRHEVHFGKPVKLKLRAGDLLTLINIDGAATVSLSAFSPDGANALKHIGLQDLQILANATNNMALAHPAFVNWIKARGGDFDSIMIANIFDHLSPAGERFVIRIGSDCDFWASVARSSDLEAASSGGTITIEHKPVEPIHEIMPDPIGTIRDEFRIDAASARAYRVAKGEFIQVIDVQGQQCSDFMALRADTLDANAARYIDSTVSRTMARGAYPSPGLYDKFYDQDIRPLLAVTQDTVGRHDTFALACTARGYEERGFPGHVNCSDNISDQLMPYGIERKPAWPAINFFFNSWISRDDNRLASDEAWSRPGDYVVMQALTDLVCVSTACPDDIDPINGWNPTDVHVRIYKSENSIQRAIAHRPLANSEPSMTEHSAFHERTSKLTSSFEVSRDVWLPASYEATRAIDEYWACKEHVTIQDMSSLRKYDVTGPDAEKLLQHCMSKDIHRLSVNRGVYALILSESGTVIDDGTLFRLAPQLFRWCCGSEESARQLKTVAEELGYRVWIKALWSGMPNLAIQGPRSRDLLSRLVFTQPTHPALQNVKWFGFTFARIKDREGAPFMLTRSGFTGELGYEIFCNQTDALEIWDGVMEAGSDLNITPMGGEALETTRIEAGLMSAAHEFSQQTDALEAGLEFAVDFRKDHFIGRDALIRNRNAPRKKLVGLLLHGAEVPTHGDPIFLGHLQVGTVTSATMSPALGRPIAMARVNVETAATGAQVEIGRLDGMMKRLVAEITTIPFIDPKREKARV